MKLRYLVLTIVFSLLLYGDVMYEMVTKTEAVMGTPSGEIMTRVFIKGDRSRTEMTTRTEVGEIANIYITRLDKKVVWVLDTARKEYSEISLAWQDTPGEDLDTTFVTPEIKIEKTEEKKEILKIACEKVIVSMNIKSEEGAIKMTQTMWLPDSFLGLAEIEKFNKNLKAISGKTAFSPIMGIDERSFNKFQEEITEIAGFPLEIDLQVSISNEELNISVKTHSKVTNIAAVPISDRVFEIPTGYVPAEH